MKEKEKATSPRFNTSTLALGWNNEEGDDWADSIKAEEVSAYSQAAHKRDAQGYDISQNAMCFEVLGAISLIVGILFIFLSLQKRRNKIVGVNFASLAFVICVITLALGIGCIAYGTYRLIKASRIRKEAKRDIAFLAKLNQK